MRVRHCAWRRDEDPLGGRFVPTIPSARGEDGPTHQPVEQLASLRLTPNMETRRGCDQVEVAVASQQAIERKDGPTSLVLTRQPLA